MPTSGRSLLSSMQENNLSFSKIRGKSESFKKVESFNQTSIVPHLHSQSFKVDSCASPENKLFKWLKQRNSKRTGSERRKVSISKISELDLTPHHGPAPPTINKLINSLKRSLKWKKQQLEAKENDFMNVFNAKRKLVQKFKKFKITFSRQEFNDLTLDELQKLGDERRCRIEAKEREIKYAKVIQKHWKNYLSRKQYKQAIQDLCEVIEEDDDPSETESVFQRLEEEKRLIIKKKTHFLSFFTDYVVRFKYLKPRLYTLLRQLERIMKAKRDKLWTTAIILIQYHVRKWLKKIRARRAEQEAKKAKKPVKKKQGWKRPNWRAPAKYANQSKQDKEKQEKIKKNLDKLKGSFKKKKKKAR